MVHLNDRSYLTGLEESPYRHLISTNTEPRDLEILEVRHIVEQKELRLAQLAAQINSTKATFNYSLIEQREIEKGSLLLFHNILSPIRRLPQDTSRLRNGGNEWMPSTPSIRYLAYKGHMRDLPAFHSWQLSTGLQLLMHFSDRPTLMGILSKCTALVEFNAALHDDIPGVNGNVDLNPAILGSERIVMPHLETLDMEHYLHSMWLLSYLTLPALTQIILSYISWPTATFNSLQSRSLFPLKSITLYGVGPLRVAEIGASDFLELIRRTPSITEFKSDAALVITPELISGLKAPSQNGALGLGPNLEYLEMTNMYPHGSRSSFRDAGMVLDMLASRNPSGNPAAFETDQYERMQTQLCQSGFEVSIFTFDFGSKNAIERGSHIPDVE
ncbi:hypothetical protein Hypma_004113 [Hypsizygus marmoreus]|uniref:Uncharacterized protein n=1 Tax=Hypsizygus marmoreus TaxID=39966 RepID=A0A369K6K6_HYPMA|nr:hypothetical protein Hypma_004113 [Hypsizygus marmoreus]